MELLEYIKSLSAEELEDFALGVGTTVPHLRNVAYKARVASAALAAQIQVRSRGQVQVSTLRPKDWHLVWGREVNQTMNPDAIVADGSGTAPHDGVAALPGVSQDGSASSPALPAAEGEGGVAHGANVAQGAAEAACSQTELEKV